MAGTTIARTYASALLELGLREGEADAYGRAFGELTTALQSDPRVRRFLETPKVDEDDKQRVLRQALGGRVPERFLRFVLVVLSKRRQRLLPRIQREYQELLNKHAGRVQADVTVARQPDAQLERTIKARLSEMIGKDVEPRFHVDTDILGGLVVRYGDRVIDGSVRRQLLSLRRDMMRAGLPEIPAATAEATG